MFPHEFCFPARKVQGWVRFLYKFMYINIYIHTHTFLSSFQVISTFPHLRAHSSSPSLLPGFFTVCLGWVRGNNQRSKPPTQPLQGGLQRVGMHPQLASLCHGHHRLTHEAEVCPHPVSTQGMLIQSSSAEQAEKERRLAGTSNSPLPLPVLLSQGHDQKGTCPSLLNHCSLSLCSADLSSACSHWSCLKQAAGKGPQKGWPNTSAPETDSSERGNCSRKKENPLLCATSGCALHHRLH